MKLISYRYEDELRTGILTPDELSVLPLEAVLPETTLLSMRITSLPLTVEEAEAMEEQEWESNDLNAIEMRGGKIDMSALEARDRAEAARDKRS